MTKITIGRLSQFQRDAGAWFGQNPQNPGQFTNKQNVESPLGECIIRIMPDVEALVGDWVDLGAKYNQEVSKMKAQYADKVTVNENSANQQNVNSAYEYTGSNLVERNRVIQSLWDKLLLDRKELELKEVEIEPIYVKNVPPVQLLSPNFVTSFCGLVIDPEYDSNKLMTVKR